MNNSKNENQENDDAQTKHSNETETKPVEQRSSRRSAMPQDVRYSTEPEDQIRILKKFENYQISPTNSCQVRFLIDDQQKAILFGENSIDEENFIEKISKKFELKISSILQQSTKFSYKIFGTEENVRRCLIEFLGKIFKRENNENEFLSAEPTAVFVTTINPDSSITEEAKAIRNIEKTENHQNRTEFKTTENFSDFKFTFLVSPNGNEVLKKNLSFFGPSLEQRFNVVLDNVARLTKFGEKEIFFEFILTSKSIESIVDAGLQITAFINEVLSIPTEIYKTNGEQIENENRETSRRKSNNFNSRNSPATNQTDRVFFNRNRTEIFEEKILLRNDCVARIVGKRGSNIKLIKNKCHLRDLTIGREVNENGYNECFISSFQARNINFAIDTIRSFLYNEDSTAVVRLQIDQEKTPIDESDKISSLSNLVESTLKFSSSNKESIFTTKSFQLNTTNNFPQHSYNFQNPPSFDFTHQATSASRKTDKRPGDLAENSPCLQTPNEHEDHRHVHSSSSASSSISPRHRSKRTCPETKEIHCTTEDGFWIQKQYYQALDDASKQIFDNLLEQLEKIRIANEENAAKKQQRIAGRNRSTKTRNFSTPIVSLNEENNLPLKSIDKEVDNVKLEVPLNGIEEKENHQDLPTILLEQH